MGILDELKNDYGLTDEDLEFALQRAKGILLGYAMEHKAIRVLTELNFENVVFVDKPTHDFEALKGGEKYYIEVKATKKSPTREYSAFKLAMIAALDGIHATLVMKPEPKLYLTEEILSEPKRVLLGFFRRLYEGDEDKLLEFVRDKRNLEILMNYRRVLTQYKQLIEKYQIDLTP